MNNTVYSDRWGQGLAAMFALALGMAAPLTIAASHAAEDPAASEAKGEASKTEASDAAKEGEGAANTIVDITLPPILAPMIVNARLTGYAYITISLTPSSPANILPIRSKVPFIQDAFVRELNKGTIVRSDDPKQVDADAIKTRLTARMKDVLTGGMASDLKIDRVEFSPLRS